MAEARIALDVRSHDQCRGRISAQPYLPAIVGCGHDQDSVARTGRSPQFSRDGTGAVRREIVDRLLGLDDQNHVAGFEVVRNADSQPLLAAILSQAAVDSKDRITRQAAMTEIRPA
ncbi:MAG: hypothetical protein U5M50_07240 [Sphingobium sp.]|nr:hypothetical protein [Sphingobium sp.]